ADVAPDAGRVRRARLAARGSPTRVRTLPRALPGGDRGDHRHTGRAPRRLAAHLVARGRTLVVGADPWVQRRAPHRSGHRDSGALRRAPERIHARAHTSKGGRAMTAVAVTVDPLAPELLHAH